MKTHKIYPTGNLVYVERIPYVEGRKIFVNGAEVTLDEKTGEISTKTSGIVMASYSAKDVQERIRDREGRIYAMGPFAAKHTGYHPEYKELNGGKEIQIGDCIRYKSEGVSHIERIINDEGQSIELDVIATPFISCIFELQDKEMSSEN